MNTVTPETIAALHKSKETLKGQLEQAKGKLAILEHQVEEKINELDKLGVTPDTAQTKIDELNNEVVVLYGQANELLEEIKNAIN